MSDTKHSPGPWAWDPEDPEDGAPHSLFSKGLPYTQSGLSVYFEPGNDMTDQDRANLRLIAAAPVMAAMLEELEWGGGDAVAVCPFCGERPSHKRPVLGPPIPGRPGFVAYTGRDEYVHGAHLPDCRLAALLAELRKP
jgi:hypothetical protein